MQRTQSVVKGRGEDVCFSPAKEPEPKCSFYASEKTDKKGANICEKYMTCY